MSGKRQVIVIDRDLDATFDPSPSAELNWHVEERWIPQPRTVFVTEWVPTGEREELPFTLIPGDRRGLFGRVEEWRHVRHYRWREKRIVGERWVDEIGGPMVETHTEHRWAS